MSKKRRSPRPDWTPPIFGWQYKLHWQLNGSDVRADSWDWDHWGSEAKYFVWVSGIALGVRRVHWNVYFSAGPSGVRVRFSESDYSLARAIRKVEKQVQGLEDAIRELRAHSKGGWFSGITTVEGDT